MKRDGYRVDDVSSWLVAKAAFQLQSSTGYWRRRIRWPELGTFFFDPVAAEGRNGHEILEQAQLLSELRVDAWAFRNYYRRLLCHFFNPGRNLAQQRAKSTKCKNQDLTRRFSFPQIFQVLFWHSPRMLQGDDHLYLCF